MKSLFASARSMSGLDRLDQVVREFESGLERGGLGLEPFLERLRREQGASIADDPAVLTALIKADLRLRFERGESPGARDYLSRFPGLGDTDSRMLSLIYEEYCLLEEQGETVDVESFCDRYPRWKESLLCQLEYHRLISQAVEQFGKPRFPAVGGAFSHFDLVSLLGKGGSSQVYLARDTTLGNRRVALKVAVNSGSEPDILGKLKHEHIIPIYSVVDESSSRLRGLSMPFQPGLPLDRVIERIKSPRLPRKALVLWRALIDDPEVRTDPHVRAELADETDFGAVSADAGGEDFAVGLPSGDGWKGFPVRGSYARGVAWLGATLATALRYAHEKKIYHRDIKPGNVLLTVRRGPQLLDFNLAESPHSADQAAAALRGGTLPYMAPEQIEAFINPSLWGLVGAQADIYSLGLVLRELLTGLGPDLPDDSLPRPAALRELLNRRASFDVSTRSHNKQVPAALDAIVAKCLAYDPAARYPTARQLADDLQEFLAFRPSRLAPNPSRSERVRYWAVRRRRTLVAGTFVGAVLALGLSRPVMNGFKPPVARTDWFRAASQALDDPAHNRTAASILTRLADEYPASPIPPLMLSFALSEGGYNSQGAVDAFRRAAARAPLDRTAVSLIEEHPDLAHHFCEFARARIGDATGSRSGGSDDASAAPSSTSLSERDRRVLLYEQAEAAARIALQLSPEEPDRGYAEQALASAEQFFGRFAEAHERLSAVIEAIDARRDPGLDGKRFSFALQRGKIALAWAISIRGDEPNKAVELLEAARVDLDRCSRYELARQPSPAFRLYFLRTDAILTLAELRRDAGEARAAAASYREANRSFSKLREALSRLHLENPVEEDRFKQAVLDQLRSRLRPDAASRATLSSPATSTVPVTTTPLQLDRDAAAPRR
jgi:serine/threonine protein kinase